MSLSLLSDVLAAATDAHAPRVLVRALARAVAKHLPITRLDFAGEAVELADGEWRRVDGEPRGARVLASGLSVVTAEPLPAFCAEPAFREALDRAVAALARHVEVVQRVAALSRRAHAETRELRDRLKTPELVARSPAMRSIVSRAELVAKHPTTVLLTGESGTGKEVLARHIHQASPRAARPIVQINCGALPPGLVESELFGHERGAFTGAIQAHAGAFERAHRGTLFLDEVGDLPLDAQVKLLRVLQERAIRRVGGTEQIEVDVRLIAATNRDLAALVEAGTFREDLYYRLAVFALELPPLRDRRDDLAPLVAALVRQLAAKLGFEMPAIPRTAIARLEGHDWPGNVRELANVLEAALILGHGTLELPERFVARRRAATTFDTAVRGAIENALRASRGKIYGAGGAAERLGMPPATLQSKMRKLGIERTAFV